MLGSKLRSKTYNKRLEDIERRLQRLESIVPSLGERASMRSLNLTDLASIEVGIPDSLRKTMMAILELKEATAEETASKTGRTRSLETIYLNQLARMGYLSRLRKGRKVYFKPLRYY